MNTLHALIEAVRAEPEDDLPRQAYADFLEEQGEADHANYVRWQIASDRKGERIKPTPQLRWRKWFDPPWPGVTSAYYDHWDGTTLILCNGSDHNLHGVNVRRGLIDEACLPRHCWPHQTRRLLARWPLRRVQLSQAWPLRRTWNDGGDAEHCWFPQIPGRVPGHHEMPREVFDLLVRDRRRHVDGDPEVCGAIFRNHNDAYGALSSALLRIARNCAEPAAI